MFDTIRLIHSYATRPRDQPVIARCKTSLVASKTSKTSLPEEILNTPVNIIDEISTHSYDGFSPYFKQYCLGIYNPTCEIENCNVCNNAS